LAAALGIVALPRDLLAQGAPKIARIGWLTTQQASALAPYLDALRSGLAEFGYEEGRNLVVEYRYGDDVIERVPELATGLVKLPVALIVAQGSAVSVLNRLGLRTPVVYVYSGDPVSAGFAESLAKPLGNMTGLTMMAVNMNGKRLEVLREIIPELRRVAVVGNPAHPGEHHERLFSDETGRRLGLTVTHFLTRTPDELTAAFQAMAADPPQAISVLADGFAIQNRKRIVDFAMSQRVPVISGWSVFAHTGALCTYGPRISDSYRRVASYIDRILKGAKPADLPIEQPTKFELIINLNTGRALNLTIPPTLLARADEVIE
jgi:putative ABC transport system substrate-binding protein